MSIILPKISWDYRRSERLKKTMIRSMTGFGKFEVMRNERRVTVEMKSVNHRYLDANVKMPRKFNAFEAEIRNIIKDYAVRGKIDMYINYEDLSCKDSSLVFNENIAAEYIKYAEKMEELFGLKNDMTVMNLMKSPEVLNMEEVSADEEELLSIIKEAVKGACEKFADTRTTEGENLKNDLISKLDALKITVDKVAERSPKVLEEYRAKLEAKVSELLDNTQIEPSRIATEVTIFADKMCVDEEIVRLNSHIDNMKAELNKGGELGKRLDFLTQEMNRESNTILSKANDLEVTNLGIELKTEIEKIREQIQNIE